MFACLLRKARAAAGLNRGVEAFASFQRALSSNRTEKIMSEFTLRIDNMHCGSCVRRVSQALASTPGLEVKEVRVGAARLSSALSPAPVDAALAALAKAGYPARLED